MTAENDDTSPLIIAELERTPTKSQKSSPRTTTTNLLKVHIMVCTIPALLTCCLQVYSIVLPTCLEQETIFSITSNNCVHVSNLLHKKVVFRRPQLIAFEGDSVDYHPGNGNFDLSFPP